MTHGKTALTDPKFLIYALTLVVGAVVFVYATFATTDQVALVDARVTRLESKIDKILEAVIQLRGRRH